MDLLKMMSQFKDMKGKMKEMEEKLRAFEAKGISGDVKVTVNGKLEVVNIDLPADITRIAPEDLKKKIMSAYADALKQVKNYIEKEFGFIKNALGGLI